MIGLALGDGFVLHDFLSVCLTLVLLLMMNIVCCFHVVVTPEIEHYSGSYFNQMGERIKGSTWLAAAPGE